MNFELNLSFSYSQQVLARWLEAPLLAKPFSRF